MWPKSPESFTNSIRYALLTLVFCVVMAVELVHAKFALLTLSELHAYWLGRYGYFPFIVLPWSERHFGGDALAMRLPLLVIFALLLTAVLLVLNRLLKKYGPTTLVGGTLVLLAALAVQQYFALKSVRRERREFTLLLDHVERAAGPGEPVMAEWNLALPLYAYGSDTLRQQLRSTLDSFPNVPPVKFYAGASGEEMIYVGSVKDHFAQRQFAAVGYQFREDEMAQADETAAIARYYRAAGTSIYFVSPPARDAGREVLSKP
jgi:hypothetical protein